VAIPDDIQQASELAREMLTQWVEVSTTGFLGASRETTDAMFDTFGRVEAAGLPHVLMCLSSLATTAIELLAEASEESRESVLQRLLLAEEATLRRQWGGG
jgi:hypothetical protein